MSLHSWAARVSSLCVGVCRATKSVQQVVYRQGGWHIITELFALCPLSGAAK
jgi:hypothetical protein